MRAVTYMAKKRKIIDEQQSHTPILQSSDDWEPWYVNRDMSLGQSNVQTSDVGQMTQEFQQWHLHNNYYQPTIDVDVYSKPEGDVTTLMLLAIPKQPKDNWFNMLADIPAVVSPLETLAWLQMPDSPSLGKRTFHSETGPNTPRYGPAEYEAITDPDGAIARPTEPSGSNEQDDLEDHEAKKVQIQMIISAEIHQHITVQVPDSSSTVYEACDDHDDSPVEYWQPEDICHEDYGSYGPSSIPDDAPDLLFMGNDSCSEDITSGAYYTYNTDLTDHFSHSPYYTYNCDS